MIALRPYQESALARCASLVRLGWRRILIVAPTGSGKGVLAVRLAKGALAKGRRPLFVAPRRVIVEDTYRRILRAGMDPNQLGVLMGERTLNPHAPCLVASLDTLRRRRIGHVDLLILDEAHMALDAGRELADRYPDAVLLGLTATPERGDGRGLGELYEDLVEVAKPSQMIAEGWLVEPRCYTVPASALPDLSSIPLRGGDYEPGALERAVLRSGLVGSLVEHWRARAAGRRAVVFAASVQHSRSIVDEFRAAGVRAEHIDAETPIEKRDQILARLESLETQVVSSCGVLTTGWDQPSVKVAICARPTASGYLWVQMGGRILRPWQGVEALLLDHAGNCLQHGLPHADRPYSLEGRRPRTGHEVPIPRTCPPPCWALYPAELAVCPACGTPAASSAKARGAPAASAGDLVEVTGQQTDQPRNKAGKTVPQYLAGVCYVARSQGFGPAWVRERFATAFPDVAIPPEWLPRIAKLAARRRTA